MTNTGKLLQTATVIATLLTGLNASAAEIKIINNVGEQIQVDIEKGTGAVLPGKQQERVIVDNKHEKLITVDRGTLDGEETFTLTAKRTAGLTSSSGVCKSLLVTKDYDVVFLENKAGLIICQETERK